MSSDAPFLILGGRMYINEVNDRERLAILLDVPLQKLTYILYVKKTDNCYKQFQIPKKDGIMRIICAPNDELKVIQRKLANELWKYHLYYMEKKNIESNISHGFVKGRSILTNANIHVNKKYIVNMDIEDFFPSIHFGRVRGYFNKSNEFNLSENVSTIIAQLTCYQGVLPQGAPTSPILANLLCNILDMRLLKVCAKYKVDYSRYADDMTFSTNDKYFIVNQSRFIDEIEKEVEEFGFKINKKKTRLDFYSSRQNVTGLIVNQKIGVDKKFRKDTRAMAYSLYKNGEFKIDGEIGSVYQLEGRFAFIDQIDKYNNKSDIQKNIWGLNSREREYLKFLFYKNFFATNKPVIITEGKTDIYYLKAALQKYYVQYPKLITKKDEKFIYNINFFERNSKTQFFFNIKKDGADTLKNIYNLYTGLNNFPNLYKYFLEVCKYIPKTPVILLFDNEQKTNRPLKNFLKYINYKDGKLIGKKCLIGNLYIMTNPLVKNLEECEIEDLFDDEVLNVELAGKTFSRDKNIDLSKKFGKSIFADYVLKNYKSINFENFKPILDSINE